ncbi:hypothetical protein MXB_3968 [Myxobolus squamalis]|nr:hypothetical protein MXB_3968 [Myxobolus squamalis]
MRQRKLMNLTSKTRKDFQAADSLFQESKNAMLLPAPITAGRKIRRMGKDKKVTIAVKLWLESTNQRAIELVRQC